jgi:glycosyltransferase involved in cell wall biosynthesis
MVNFSVVIPVYNKKPHIDSCVNSVLNQTNQSFELLIICDPSTDGSEEVIALYECDKRVSIHYRKKAGPGGYAARNLGVDKAKFDWICFLDADDEWLPNHLESLALAINSYPTYKVFSTGWVVDAGLNTKLDKFSSKMNIGTGFFRELNFPDYLLYESKAWRPIWTGAACIERSLMQRAGGFPDGEIKMGGDVDTWLRCVFYANGMVRLGVCSSIYHTDSVNMVTKSAIIKPDLHLHTYNKLTSNYDLSKETKTLLQLRLNKLVLYAWKHNARLGYNKEFKLLKFLFINQQPVLVIAIFIINNTLPSKLIKYLLNKNSKKSIKTKF